MFTEIKRHNWTQSQYFAFDAVSNSTLTRMDSDPSRTHDRIFESSAMRLGTAFDQYLLDPETFKSEWTVIETDNTPSEGNQTEFAKLVLSGTGYEEAYRQSYVRYNEDKAKELYDSLEGWFFLKGSPKAISSADMKRLETMRASVYSLPKAVESIERASRDGGFQVCFTGRHEETGLLCKGMLDILDENVEIDVKSTSSRWSQITKKWVEDRGYDTQRAMYAGLSGADASRLLIARTEDKMDARYFDVTARINAMMWRGGRERETAFDKLDRLIREYKWRTEKNKWDHTMNYYANGGVEIL